MKKTIFYLVAFLIVVSFTPVHAEEKRETEEGKLYYIIDNMRYVYKEIPLEKETELVVKKVLDYVDNNPEYTLDEINNVIGQYSPSINYGLSNSNTDWSYYLPTLQSHLNDEEIELFNSNPVYGLSILLQASTANSKEVQLFGNNTRAGNGDAFRHSYWNALGAHYTSQDYMEAFATAHETGAADYDPTSLDYKMAMYNNARGRYYVSIMTLPTNPPNGATIPYLISNEIASKVQNGYMRRFRSGTTWYTYLIVTNSSSTN